MNCKTMLLAAVTMAGTPALASAPQPPPFSSPPRTPTTRLGPSEEVLTAILQLIHRTNSSVPAARAARIATLIVIESEARRLDPLILAGIIAQESHFHASVQHCLGGYCDLGLGQVNWETWGQALRLDRKALLHDDAYNVAVAAGILADTRDRFGTAAGWWTRYHDHRPDRRIRYGQLVRAHAPALFGHL